MKRMIRALGVDDGYFTPHVPGKVDLVGVLTRAPNYVEGVLIRKIEVDGDDVTNAILSMLSSRYGPQVRLIMTQGITFGGFNILNLRRLYEETSIPVLVVSRKEPDLESMKDALKQHFPDWRERVRRLEEVPIERVENGEHNLWVQYLGMDRDEVTQVIKLFTIRGAIPEPVRVAHLIASALPTGESRGKP